VITIRDCVPLTASSLQPNAPWICESNGKVYSIVNSSIQSFDRLGDPGGDLLRHALAAGAQLCFLAEEFTSLMGTTKVDPDRVFAELWKSRLIDTQTTVDGLPVACVSVTYRAIDFLIPKNPVNAHFLLARREETASGWPSLVSLGQNAPT
jgi:hypothetical protein